MLNRRPIGPRRALPLFFLTLILLGGVALLVTVAPAVPSHEAAAQTPGAWNTTSAQEPGGVSGAYQECSQYYSGYVYVVGGDGATGAGGAFSAYGAISSGVVSSWTTSTAPPTAESWSGTCWEYDGYMYYLPTNDLGEIYSSPLSSSGFGSWTSTGAAGELGNAISWAAVVGGSTVYYAEQSSGQMVLWGLGLEASGAVNPAGRANGGTTGVSDSGGVTDVQAISYSGGDLYLWWNNGAADKNCQGYQSASGTTFGAWNLYNSGTCVAASGTGGVLYPTSDLNNACVLYTELVCVDSTGAVYDYSGSAWATDPHSMVVGTYGTGGGGNQCQATDHGTFILCAGLSNGVDNVVVAVSSAPSTVTLPIKITIGASGTHTNSGFSMSGGSPSPSSSIEANTAGYTTDITINPSTYWTLTAPTANSTSRIEYYNSTSSSATNVYEGESCSSGTCSTVDITFYYQLKSTASYTLSGGGSPTAPTLAYTGFGGTVDYTLTGTGTAEWLDFGSTWSSTNPLTGSNSSTRFDAGSGTGGTATAGATIAPAYYHQEACSCSYSGTVASAPSIDGTAFGSSGASTALTGTPTSVWLDLGGSYTITKPAANFPSATERYETNAGNGTVTTHFTLAPVFYQQFIQGAKYSWMCIAGHTCTGATVTLTYTSFGSAGATLGETTSLQNVWIDAASTASVTASITDTSAAVYTTSPTSWSITAANLVGNPSIYASGQVVLSVTVTPKWSGYPVTISASGCGTNSSSFTGRGTVHLAVNPSCSSLTLSVPAATSSVRSFFSKGLNASEVFTTPSGSGSKSFAYQSQFRITNDMSYQVTAQQNGSAGPASFSSQWADAGTNITVDIPQFLPTFFVSSQEFVYFEPYFSTNFVVLSNDSLSAFSYAGQGVIQFTGGSTYGKVWNSASYPVQQVSFTPSGSATKTGTTSWNGNLMTGWFTAQPAGAGAFYQLSFNIPVLGGGGGGGGGGSCVENCSPPHSNATTSSTSSPSGTGGSPGGSGSGGNGPGPGGTPTGNPVLPQPDTEIFIGSLLILLLLLLAFAYKKARKEVDRAESRFEGKFKQPKRDGRKGI